MPEMKRRPPQWDVTQFVKDIERASEEVRRGYRRINLMATLTWGLTNAQIYRSLKLEQVLNYLLDGAVISRSKAQDSFQLSPTIDNAVRDGYFPDGADVGAVRAALDKLRKIAIGKSSLPVARLVNLEHFYWGDCSHEDFPKGQFHTQFQVLKANGLEMEFYYRFDPEHRKYPALLEPLPGEAWRIGNLLARFGELTIAQMQTLHPWDVRSIEWVS